MAVAPKALLDMHQQEAVEIQDERIQTLRDAVERRDKTAIWAALASEVDPNANLDKGFTALHVTACDGTVRMAEILVSVGANINQQNDTGNTPLHLCILNRERGFFIAKFLIKKGVDLSKVNCKGETPLDLAKLWVETLHDYPERAMVRLLKKHSS